MHFETRLEVSDDSEKIHDRSDDSIKIEVNVVRSNISSQSSRSVSSLLAGVLGAHITGMENTPKEFVNVNQGYDAIRSVNLRRLTCKFPGWC